MFQTIFLDKDGSRELWTDKGISDDKRIYEKWWKQASLPKPTFMRTLTVLVCSNHIGLSIITRSSPG